MRYLFMPILGFFVSAGMLWAQEIQTFPMTVDRIEMTCIRSVGFTTKKAYCVRLFENGDRYMTVLLSEQGQWKTVFRKVRSGEAFSSSHFMSTFFRNEAELQRLKMESALLKDQFRHDQEELQRLNEVSRMFKDRDSLTPWRDPSDEDPFLDDDFHQER